MQPGKVVFIDGQFASCPVLSEPPGLLRNVLLEFLCFEVLRQPEIYLVELVEIL